MFRFMRASAAFAVMLTMAACASSRMAAVSEPGIVTAPPADKAVVVFLRPSTFGFGVQSSVFDVTQSPPTFVGIVSSTSKVAYASPPGERRFMVVSEAADFMDAQLEAGKTYYALVTPRIGAWKARFSLRPVAADDDELAGWLESCSWFGNTPLSERWAHDHENDVMKKHDEYLPRWLEKSDRPVLRAGEAR